MIERLSMHLSFAGSLMIGAAILIMAVSQAMAHSSKALISADEITRVLEGKTCSTKAGAKFAFGRDGQYSYDGLWKNGGRYTVTAGMVTITLDNGLERSFVISRRGEVLFMEQTALTCDQMDVTRAE